MTLRTGLIGLGMMGRHHARVMRDIEGTELVAVADAIGDARLPVPRFDAITICCGSGTSITRLSIPKDSSEAG